MPLDQSLLRSSARQPRAIVRVNGAPVPGWLSWEVNNNSFYQADTFRVSFATSALPTKTVQPFLEQSELFVEILAGFPSNPDRPAPSELTSLIYGRVDSIELDPCAKTLTYSGRDLTGALIDKHVLAEYSNQKASDIAAIYAAEHTLVPRIKATTDFVGVPDQRSGMVKLEASGSQWDVLHKLARDEGYVCFVRGQDLHFEPAPAGVAEPYLIEWQDYDDAPASANVQQLSFSRAMTVAKGVTVTVRSVSTKSGRTTVVSYPGPAKAIQAGKASPFGESQAYDFKLPANTEPNRCLQIAQERYRELVSHEMKLHARMPADDQVQPDKPLMVQGTQTMFDQLYYVMDVTREMSMDEGYTMTVQAQNRRPQVAG